MRHPNGRLVHTSEILGQYQERTAREEPKLPSSSDPYGLITTEQARHRRPLSRPLSSGSEEEAIEN